ncbi:tetratricopeptide repeat protein [Limibacter armeniacum]|uniref:tetratricopeptide repeat protein n=1 Tax=Limibacter armeniacum TaxID=466084 RepID=UPI002FE616C3
MRTLFSFYLLMLLIVPVHAQKSIGELNQQINELCRAGKYTEASAFAEQYLAQAAEKLGTKHPHYLEALKWTINIYKKANLNDKAETGYQELLYLKEQSEGKDSSSYAQTLNNLGLLYFGLERYKEAEPLFESALEIVTLAPGKEHPYYIRTKNNLAMLYKSMGRYKEAETAFSETLELVKTVLGEEDKEYASTLNNLGLLYMTTGDYAKSEDMLVRALQLKDSIYGRETPEYGASLHNLGMLCQEKGLYKKAEQLYKKALEIAEASFGKEHLYYTNSLRNLAELYQRMGLYPEAEQRFKEAITLKERVNGKDHTTYAKSISNLAVLYTEMGRYQEAEPLYKEAMEIKARKLGYWHPEYAESLNSLGDLYRSMARYEEAEPLYTTAQKINREQLGMYHPAYAGSLHRLAILNQDLGRFDTAEYLFKKALRFRESILGTSHPAYAQSLGRLATLYFREGDYDKAEPLFKESLAVKEKSLGRIHPAYAEGLNDLSLLYSNTGRWSDAESLYKEAMFIRGKVLGTHHPAYAESLHNLAGLYQKMGKYGSAESLYQQALELKKETLNTTHPSYAESLHQLAELYRKTGQYQMAESMMVQAAKIKLSEYKNELGGSSEAEKKQFLEANQGFFENLDHIFIEQTNKWSDSLLESRFEIQLALKGFLLNSVQGIKHRILKSGSPKLIEEYHKWQSVQEQIARVGNLSAEERKKQGVSLRELKRQANKLEKYLSLRSESFRASVEEQETTWEDIQKSLAQGEVAVELVRMSYRDEKTTGSQIYYTAFIITPEVEMPVAVVLSDGDKMEQQYFKQYSGYVSGASRGLILVDNKIDLYSAYWQPIWKKIQQLQPDAQHIYMAADGVYNQLNPAILENTITKQYQLDEADIHRITSTRDIVSLKQAKVEPSGAIEEAVLFGRPSFELQKAEHMMLASQSGERNAGVRFGGIWKEYYFEDLPGTEKEVHDIEKILQQEGWKVTTHFGKEALEEEVKAVKSPRVLHIATHGFFMKSDSITKQDLTEAMLRSGLVMAGAQTYFRAEQKYDVEDGILTAYEAMHLDLENTELVVLSACETGLGQVETGEGVYGLERAFTIAGADAVLISLWQVDDFATQELMTAFYQQWMKTGDKRKAFREAQLQLKQKYRRPYYWGGFIMIGE